MNAARFQDARRNIDREFRDKPSKIKKAFAHLVARSGATIIVLDRRVIGWRMKTGEIVCVKHRYGGEAQATRVMNDIADNHKGTRVPVRVYQCGHCSGWHLTSQLHKENHGTETGD